MSELQESSQQEQRVGEKTGAAGMSMPDSLKVLGDVGGFEFIEAVVDGAQNLNPERKARKNIFLTDPDKKEEKEALKKKLEMWRNLLSTDGSIDELAKKCQASAEDADKLLKSNLKNAMERTRELETSYRSLALFYKNSDAEKVKNITIMNASMEQLQDLDAPDFIDYVAGELKDNYDKLSLKDNYSLLCIPGYLGSNKVVSKWAKIAHENKVMLVTDFEDLKNSETTIRDFEDANLTSADMSKSNVIMCGNYLVGRGKNEEVGEETDVMVPPSSSLAGRLYTTLMSQVSAGSKFGTLNEVDSVRFDMRKSEIGEFDKLGLVPMVKEYGKVMAFSAKTLFNGDNLGLQTYSVVRVFDYINKVLIDFLNRRAFENWTSLTEKDLREQIVKFLDGITGPKSLIEKFTIRRFEKDPDQKDRIHLDIHITPYFPAKSFMLKLDGTKGDDGSNWDTSTQQL